MWFLEVRGHLDLTGLEVVENPDFGTGCSSSIRSALGVVDPRSDGIVLLLGDQPGVASASVRSLLAAAGPAMPIAVSRYDDGRGIRSGSGETCSASLLGSRVTRACGS